MPLTCKKKGGTRYLIQPFFTQQLGVFSRTDINQDVISSFLTSIPAVYKYIDINLNASNYLKLQNYPLISQVNYELDLVSPYEKIHAGYSENLKRNLKRKGAASIKLAKDTIPLDIIKLFKENKGRELAILNDKEYRLLEKLTEVLRIRNQCQVWGAYNQSGKLIAGVIWAFSNRKAVFLFSAVSDEGREVSAMPVLIDHFIHEHSNSMLILDFEGSNNANLARFYSGFGSRQVHYYRLTLNRLPMLPGLALQFLRRFREI
jgi:hypothetical protein